MEPITTIIVAGATVAFQEITSDTVKDAYHALRDIIKNNITSLANLEEAPDDEDYRKAANKELSKKGLNQDPAVLEKVKLLKDALEREPSERLQAAGVDIRNIQAAGDMLITNVKAGGKIEVSGLTAGISTKND